MHNNEDDDGYGGDIGGLAMMYKRPFHHRGFPDRKAPSSTSDSDSDKRAVLSPRSLLLMEAEKVRAEAIMQARDAFKELGLRKFSRPRGSFGGSRLKKVVEHPSQATSRTSSTRASSIAQSKESLRSTTTPSPNGSLASTGSSKKRRSGSWKGSFKSASGGSLTGGSFIGDRRGRSPATSNSTEDMCDMAGSFSSLLNDSFKRSVLYEDSFKLRQLEMVLDQQFPVQRKEVMSSSDEHSSDAMARRCRSQQVRPSWLKARRPMSHFKSSRRTSWIDKISTYSRTSTNTNGTFKSTSSSRGTQSSTSRLLSGEIEWFQDDSVRELDGERGSDISFGSSYFAKHSDWQDREVFGGTRNSQCLDGFGRSSGGNSPAQSVQASFNASITQLFREIISGAHNKKNKLRTMKRNASNRSAQDALISDTGATTTGAVYDQTGLTSDEVLHAQQASSQDTSVAGRRSSVGSWEGEGAARTAHASAAMKEEGERQLGVAGAGRGSSYSSSPEQGRAREGERGRERSSTPNRQEEDPSAGGVPGRSPGARLGHPEEAHGNALLGKSIITGRAHSSESSHASGAESSRQLAGASHSPEAAPRSHSDTCEGEVLSRETSYTISTMSRETSGLSTGAFSNVFGASYSSLTKNFNVGGGEYTARRGQQAAAAMGRPKRVDPDDPSRFAEVAARWRVGREEGDHGPDAEAGAQEAMRGQISSAGNSHKSSRRSGQGHRESGRSSRRGGEHDAHTESGRSSKRGSQGNNQSGRSRKRRGERDLQTESGRSGKSSRRRRRQRRRESQTFRSVFLQLRHSRGWLSGSHKLSEYEYVVVR